MIAVISRRARTMLAFDSRVRLLRNWHRTPGLDIGDLCGSFDDVRIHL